MLSGYMIFGKWARLEILDYDFKTFKGVFWQFFLSKIRNFWISTSSTSALHWDFLLLNSWPVTPTKDIVSLGWRQFNSGTSLLEKWMISKRLSLIQLWDPVFGVSCLDCSAESRLISDLFSFLKFWGFVSVPLRCPQRKSFCITQPHNYCRTNWMLEYTVEWPWSWRFTMIF